MTHQDAPATSPQGAPTHRFIPVAEAVRILGLSATTIRRKIDAGELEAERIARPQGTAFLVKVPSDEPADAPTRAENTPSTNHDAPRTPQEAPLTHLDTPGRTDQLTAVVVPLVAQIDALRQTVDRQAEQLVSMSETIGRQAERVANLEIENGHLMARIVALKAPQQRVDAPTAPESLPPIPKPPPAWWRAWWPW
jgi:hypothetical protein